MMCSAIDSKMTQNEMTQMRHFGVKIAPHCEFWSIPHQWPSPEGKHSLILIHRQFDSTP